MRVALPTASHGRHAGFRQYPAQRAGGDRERLALGQQLREVGAVHLRVSGRGQLHQALPQSLVKAVGRSTAPVGVDEPGRPFRPIRRQQPPDLAHREFQVRRGLVRRELADEDVGEPYSRPCARASNLIVSLSMDPRVTNSLAAYGVTFSLADDTSRPRPLD